MKELWPVFAILGGYIFAVALLAAFFYGSQTGRKIHEEAIEKELQERRTRGSKSVLRE